MSPQFSSEAVVLSTKTFGEADKLIVLFTKDRGKISTIAKGVRRIKSRKRGSLEPFSKIKFSSHQGNGLPILAEVELLMGYEKIRSDLKRVAVAYFFIEVILRTMRDEEENSEVYKLLLTSLNALERGENLSQTRKDFSIKLAHILGFLPENAAVYDIDQMLESIIERKLGSVRVGKKLQI